MDGYLIFNDYCSTCVYVYYFQLPAVYTCDLGLQSIYVPVMYCN